MKRTSNLLMMGTGVNLLLTIYLHEAHKPAALSMTAQPDHGDGAVLAVWSLAAGKLDLSLWRCLENRLQTKHHVHLISCEA